MATHRLSSLDGLRALACLMVFAVHFNQFAHLSHTIGPFDLKRFLANNHIGVSLFFSLSGFLLSGPYWSALASRAPYPSTGRYLLRRAARILPAYYTCLAVLIVHNKYWHETTWLRDILLHVFLVFNYSDSTIFVFNPPFWTLAVEAQFYLLLPLLFFLLKGFQPRTVAGSLIILSVAAYFANLALWRFATGSAAATITTSVYTNYKPALIYSLLAYLPHFFLGVISRWVFMTRKHLGQEPKSTSTIGNEVLVWLSAILVIAIIGTPLDDVFQIPFGRYNLPYVPILLCVIIVLAPSTSLASSLLDSSLLRGIAAISFGLYIYHMPVLRLTARSMGRFSLNPQSNWAIFGAVALALSLAAATLSYLLVERPVLRLVKNQPAGKTPRASP